ncbi:SCO6745 family protein [Actinoplanes palleronii]|uniref:SCO6745 family protein n=1 Tax=Actinoplanes palleronii TaxID=113570 RepID=UPI00194228AD|nr:hypothetical protein [Actinoplanes palleronii]
MGTVTESPSRLAWRVTEPLHACVYLVPEGPAAYARLGLHPMGGYFAARAAALGPAGAALVAATFYNFNPAVIAKTVPAAWDTVTPEQMVATRLAVADAALTRALGVATLAGPEVAEAAELARTAALHAATRPHGRPLFAAHAELPWPDAPHLVLFHAHMLLREFRGDGHIAALLAAGISGLESIVLKGAADQVTGRFLLASRGWKPEQWAAAADGLRERGLLAGDELSDEGRRLGAELEATTDRLAEPAYATLGDAGCLRLAELTRPLSRVVVKAGLLDPAGLTSSAGDRSHPA